MSLAALLLAALGAVLGLARVFTGYTVKLSNECVTLPASLKGYNVRTSVTELKSSSADKTRSVLLFLVLSTSAYELFYAVHMWRAGHVGYTVLSVAGLFATLVVLYLALVRQQPITLVARLGLPVTLLWFIPGLVEGYSLPGPINPHLYVVYLMLVIFSLATLRLRVAVVASIVAALPLVLLAVLKPHSLLLLADALFLTVLVIFLVVFGRQSAEQRERTLNFADLALRDGLTGLANRRAAEEHLAQWMGTSPRPSGAALILCDLDHFKSLNDTYGHAAGDDALRATARALEKCLRRDDLASRWGGEEFLVLLQSVTPTQALEVASRIQSEIAHITLSIPRRMTISAGVAMLDEAYSLPELLALVDRRLYTAKNEGRNRINAGHGRFMVPRAEADPPASADSQDADPEG